MAKLCVAAAAVVGAATVFGGGLERISTCKDTTFLLEAKKGAVADVSGRYAAKDLTVSKVEFVKDGTFGEVMRFGEEPKAGISVPDGGKISFTDGLAVEAMVCPELAGKTAKALFGSKRGGSSEKLVFDANGRAALTMPPLSSAVYCVGGDSWI